MGIGLGSSDGVAATQDHNNHIRLLTDPSYFVVAMLHKQLKIIPVGQKHIRTYLIK